MSSTPTINRVRRVRHELMRRDVEVTRVDVISPHFTRITFRGDSLSSFVSESFDDHVKVIFQSEGTERVMRDYTPRSFDHGRRELTIEFALHGDGPAAEWATQAQPGQRVTIGGPRGSFVIPTDFDWHLLVGDETALPAISRRLEELPALAQAIVVCHAADPADRRAFASAASLTVQWVPQLHGLIDAVRGAGLPAGDGYAWCAGEAAVMAELRRVLVDEMGHDRHAIRAAAYWKRGSSGHHENLAE